MTETINKHLLARWLLTALLFFGANTGFGARLVVSIEPLAMLAEPLLGSEDEIFTLLPANRSPHHHAMRVSDMRALQQADLVLWVGPELEQFLTKPLAQHKAARPLSELPGLSWPEQAATGADHHHHDRDPHLWLNPDNGAVIMRWLAAQLIAQSPARAPELNQRLDAALARLQLLSQDLEAQLTPLAQSGFIVYHPAYGHWNQRFGLRQIGTVALTPEQKPGARHLVQLAALAANAQCLITEAFYENQTSQQLARQLGLARVVADPMGANIDSGLHRYEQLLTALARDFSLCLTDRQP